jgi:3-methyladenine DNA glycosylase AlkD
MATARQGSPTARAKRALAELKRLGDPKTLAGYARYGITPGKAFGIPMGKIQALGKQLGKDHALANALWKSGWYEARLLAAYVGEPDRVTVPEMERWVKGMDNWGIVDTICFVLWDKTPLAWQKVAPWCRSKEEWTKRAGFVLIACLAAHDKAATDAQFRRTLPLIARGANDERNFVKKGVSWALRHLGRRSPALHRAALQLGAKLRDTGPPPARWIGRDVVKELASPKVVAAIKKKSKRVGG